MSLTPAQRADMDKDVARVRQAFTAARPGVEEAAAAWFSFGGDAAKALLKQLNDQQATLEKWAGQWRQWAEAGKDSSGDSYSLDFWKRIGQDLANFAADTAKQSRFTLTTTVLKDTAKATADTVTDPTKWAGWMQWAVGGVAGLLVLALALRVRG